MMICGQRTEFREHVTATDGHGDTKRFYAKVTHVCSVDHGALTPESKEPVHRCAHCDNFQWVNADGTWDAMIENTFGGVK